MQTRISTFVIAAAIAALMAAPARAQRRGGGHAGGGHSGSGHSGGGHAAGGGATHGGAHASGGGRTTSGHTVVGRAVPRPTPVQPHVDRRTTDVVPSHRGHLGGLGTFGFGIRGYGYPYGYGYSPYAYSSYPGYYGGYASGYYSGYVRSGHARLRIVGAPRDAEVYVDGSYAGIVDAFDGLLQHLELAPGAHQIEIRAPGFAPIVFNLQAVGDRTITYRAQMVPYQP